MPSLFPGAPDVYRGGVAVYWAWGRRPRARADGSPTPPATRNSVGLPPPRLPSPPGPRPRHGPGRGAQGPFANQKNRRAQHDLGRRPSTAQARRRGPWRRTRTTTRTRRATTGPAAPSGWSGAPAAKAGPGAWPTSTYVISRARTSSFVLLFPARPHVGRAGPRAPRPSGSERSSSRPSCSSCTVTPHIIPLTPRVVPLSPALIRSSQSTHNTSLLPAKLTRMPRDARDALDQLIFIKHGEAQT